MDYEVSQLEDSDVEAIYELGCENNNLSASAQKNIFWPKKTLFRMIRSKDDVAVKLLVDDELAGFAFAMIHPATKKAVIENFYVTEEFEFFDLEFLEEVHKAIKVKGAEFIEYFYNIANDSNPEKMFKEAGYYNGKAHLWLHKNISFSK